MSIVLALLGIITLFALVIRGFKDLARFQIWVDDRLREIRLESLKLRADMDVLRRQIRADTEAEEKQI